VNTGRSFVGTSGWSYNHWRGLFYPADLPQREWFAYYTTYFPSVEINYTFYRLPAAKTFERWREQSPPRFVYALKAPRGITHLRKLRDATESVDRFFERARLLGDKLGPILYQLPPHWRCDVNRLSDFLDSLPENLVHVFEFRDPSWYCGRVFELLKVKQAGFCHADMPGLDCPLLATGPVVYVRMHGAGVKYGGCYTKGQLQSLAARLQDFINRGHDVFVYFNNDAMAYAVDNAYELRHLLEEMRGDGHAQRGNAV
jgi:uncharacterized protein YecE (DUF72 family)